MRNLIDSHLNQSEPMLFQFSDYGGLADIEEFGHFPGGPAMALAGFKKLFLKFVHGFSEVNRSSKGVKPAG